MIPMIRPVRRAGHGQAGRLSLLAAGALAAVVLTACGGGNGGSNGLGSSTSAPASPGAAAAGGGSGGGGGAACSPKGTSLKVTAKSLSFDTKCLAAPANTPFTLAFTNSDGGVQHNVAIYTNSSGTTNLFRGSIVTGPKTATYHVPALKPGTYYFRCDIHPTQMNGTFAVK